MSITTAVVWFHNVNSSLIWVIFTVILLKWQLNGNQVQILKFRMVKAGAVRCPVQWWARDHERDSKQCYMAINNMQFNLLATLTQNPIPIRNAMDFPIFLHCVLSGPRCLSKLSSTNFFAFSWSRNNPDCFPLCIYEHYRKYIPLYSVYKFGLCRARLTVRFPSVYLTGGFC